MVDFKSNKRSIGSAWRNSQQREFRTACQGDFEANPRGITGRLVLACRLKALTDAVLNNILPLNLRKKLALHCNNVYFCPQFEVDLYGNIRMTSVLENAGPQVERQMFLHVIIFKALLSSTNFVVLHNESK